MSPRWFIARPTLEAEAIDELLRSFSFCSLNALALLIASMRFLASAARAAIVAVTWVSELRRRFATFFSLALTLFAAGNVCMFSSAAGLSFVLSISSNFSRSPSASPRGMDAIGAEPLRIDFGDKNGISSPGPRLGRSIDGSILPTTFQ